MALTTSCAEVTCHAARVFLLLDPTVVANKPDGLTLSATGSLACVPAAEVTETGGFIVVVVLPTGNSVHIARNISSSVLSSPAQKTNSASGLVYRIRLTISPLLIAIGRTSRFFLPTSTK